MNYLSIFVFIFVMWALLLAGGGILVMVLGPISVSGFGDLNPMISSVLKAATTVILIVVWIYILVKIKNRMLYKQIK